MPPTAVTLNRHLLSRWFLAGFLAAIALVTVASAAENNPVRTKPKTQEPVTAQRVIVKFRQSSRLSIQDTTSGESLSASAIAAADTARVTALASRSRVTMQASHALGGNMHVMQVAPLTNNETAAETLARLQADSDVEFAVLDHRVYPHATTSNDPRALGQWYLKSVEKSAINAEGAWDITKGSDSVVIAVVDTGVLFGHEDLLRAGAGGKFLPGYDFVSPDGATNFTTAGDGDGRDSDPSDPGDFTSGEGSSWHGTRVSGIIGALTDNGTGIAGINWNGRILPVRVLGRGGGFNSDVLAGVRWAAGLSVSGVPLNPNPAQIINISLGSTGPCDQASASVFNEVAARGVLVVVSAGNEGGPVDSPANCPGAMGILGLRHAGTKVGFSSLGPEIALGAPGGNCVNTGAGQACLFSLDTTSNAGSTTPGANNYTDQFNTNLGTSFSSPIVSGIAGLMLSVNSNLKSAQLIARLKEGSSPFPTTSDSVPAPPVCQLPSLVGALQNQECICTTSVCGAGMANANGAVLAALRPIASIVVPGPILPGATVSLQGGGSTAANGHSIASYSWVNNGLVISSGTTATVVAPTSGTSTVCLSVTDDVGKQDTAKAVISPSSAVVSIVAGTNSCVTVSISAADATASEVGANTGTFTITRAGSTDAALAVSVAISGTATVGTDYQTLSIPVTIPAGAASASLTVTPIDDTVVDPGETVVATILSGPGYEPAAANSATVTIADDDTAAPPPASNGGGGGGGGALDPLTLFAGLAFAMFAAIRRQRVLRARAAR